MTDFEWDVMHATPDYPRLHVVFRDGTEYTYDMTKLLDHAPACVVGWTMMNP